MVYRWISPYQTTRVGYGLYPPLVDQTGLWFLYLCTRKSAAISMSKNLRITSYYRVHVQSSNVHLVQDAACCEPVSIYQLEFTTWWSLASKHSGSLRLTLVDPTTNSGGVVVGLILALNILKRCGDALNTILLLIYWACTSSKVMVCILVDANISSAG